MYLQIVTSILEELFSLLRLLKCIKNLNKTKTKELIVFLLKKYITHLNPKRANNFYHFKLKIVLQKRALFLIFVKFVPQGSYTYTQKFRCNGSIVIYMF